MKISLSFPVTLFLVSFSSSVFADGPKYGPSAEPFSGGGHREYLQHAGPDFVRLIPFYWPADTASAGSIATMSTLLSAVQSMDQKKKVNASTKNFRPEYLRKEVVDANYVVKVSGDKKLAEKKKLSLGVSLAEFRDVLEKAFTKVDITAKKAEVNLVAFKKDEDLSRSAQKEKFLADLKANEKSDDDFMVVNFTQGVLTGDPEGMVFHLSVIGAYDDKTKSVLILDPDREYYEPYWVPADKVFEAMIDKVALEKGGGYLVLKVR